MKFAGNIDKLGIIGLVVIVLFSPCCFPPFMFAATALGSGGFELLGGWTMWLFQAMVVIPLARLFIFYSRHRSVYPLLIAISAAVLMFYSNSLVLGSASCRLILCKYGLMSVGAYSIRNKQST